MTCEDYKTIFDQCCNEGRMQTRAERGSMAAHARACHPCLKHTMTWMNEHLNTSGMTAEQLEEYRLTARLQHMADMSDPEYRKAMESILQPDAQPPDKSDQAHEKWLAEYRDKIKAFMASVNLPGLKSVILTWGKDPGGGKDDVGIVTICGDASEEEAIAMMISACASHACGDIYRGMPPQPPC